jgi:Dyp-type peroxidase family
MITTVSAIREVPPQSRVDATPNDPSRQTVFEEPVLRIHNIQGAILPGFSKSHRILLSLRVNRGTPTQLAGFKCWLKAQLPFIATAEEVLAFNKLFKATRVRRKREGTIKSTWMGLSLGFGLLRDLNQEADQFTDAAFRAGLAKRSEALGDPVDGPFQAEKWLVGGPRNEADVLVVIESDERADMLDELLRVEQSILQFNRAAGGPLLEILFADEGANLPGTLSGHEHFGFLDGVSQPGIRGTLSADRTDVLTLRQNPGKRDLPKDPTQPPSTTNKINPAQGKPGQDLLWPGEFVFGYPRQIPKEAKDAKGLNPHPGPNSLLEREGEGNAAPAWAADGSYLVYRRLRQDVGGFHRFLHDQAKALGVKDPANASAARMVGAKLVGRWPSGAPVPRTPNDENAKLADDDCRNNHFEFGGDTDLIPRRSGDPSACVDDDPSVQAKEDLEGARCPFSAHIRKTYPRDDESDTVTSLKEWDTQTHRLLRRGLPYGPVSASTPDAPVFDDTDRGLQFLAYQTSIEDQFEFVIQNWVNNPDFKDTDSGHDPILGQNGVTGENRKRFFTVTIPDPADSTKVTPTVLETKADWVLPTGGGYFFTPSLSAIEKHLAVL